MTLSPTVRGGWQHDISVHSLTGMRVGASIRRAFDGRAMVLSLIATMTVQPSAAARSNDASYDDIPAAASASDASQLIAAAPLQLEIVVNGVPSGVIVPVWTDGTRLWILAGDLRALSLPAEGEAAARIALDELPGVTVDYDAPNQRLKLQVPPAWLRPQTLDLGSGRELNRARSSFGFLLNYDLYATYSASASPNAALWTDLRSFGPAGLFSSTGVLRVRRGGTSYTRYDTRWIRSNQDDMVTWEAGDLVTRTLPWNNPVRLGGIQVSRDFSVRPDVVTYPMPQFAGEATLPSAVELFVDNHKAFDGAVQPGPFTLNPLPQINGAGQASIVVTDALGRQVTTTVPFYVASTLLRAGLTDYAVAGGVLRQRYGLANFDYGGLAGSASIRHGISNAITMEGHIEAGEDLIVTGTGTVVRIGTLGVINAAYSRSWHNGRGGSQIAVGYQYQRRDFAVAVNHMRRSTDFFDLASLGRDHVPGLAGQFVRSTSATASLGLGRFGSLGVGYLETRSRERDRTRLLNASWSLPLAGSSSLFASATRDIGTRKWTASLSLLVPLGASGGTVTGNVVREENGRYATRIDYNRTVPTQGGLGWNAEIARLGNGDVYGDGNLTWRGRHAELRGGVYGTGGDVTGWLGAAGSLVWMDQALFAANRVSDAFALVSTDGHPDIPVYYENQLAGRTDKDGHLLIPWAAAYYPAKYTIDPLELSEDITADTVEQRVAVARGSGYVLDFAVRKMIAARMALVDAQGAVLPVGAVATVNGSDEVYVGWDGMLFAENLKPRNELIVHLPENGRCRASFTLDPNAGGIADLGRLTCR